MWNTMLVVMGVVMMVFGLYIMVPICISVFGKDIKKIGSTLAKVYRLIERELTGEVSSKYNGSFSFVKDVPWDSDTYK